MIPIAKAKKIREDLDLNVVVIFGIDKDGNQLVATHGKSNSDAQVAADIGNDLKNYLEWPDELCHDKPLERICQNCFFWRSLNNEYPNIGSCFINSVITARKANDISCFHMEPKY